MIVRLFYQDSTKKWLRHIYGNPQASMGETITAAKNLFNISDIIGVDYEMERAAAEDLPRALGWIGTPPNMPQAGTVSDGSVLNPPLGTTPSDKEWLEITTVLNKDDLDITATELKRATLACIRRLRRGGVLR